LALVSLDRRSPRIILGQRLARVDSNRVNLEGRSTWVSRNQVSPSRSSFELVEVQPSWFNRWLA